MQFDGLMEREEERGGVRWGQIKKNPISTWVNMNNLNRKSDLNLRWHSGNSHCELGEEKKEGIFSVPEESGQ